MNKRKIVTIITSAVVLASGIVHADEEITQSSYIKGNLMVNWATRLPGNRDGVYPKAEITDDFVYDVTVGYTMYQGTVACKPYIFSKHLGRVLQVGDCKYDVNVGVINPKNPAQTRIVGKIVGSYAIDQDGQANLNNNAVRMEIQTIGQAQGFSSGFGGSFGGKAPKAETTLSKLRDEAMKKTATITRMVGQKTVTVNLRDVDPIKFQATRLPAGPSSNYVETMVNGQLIYSYETENWFPQFTLSNGNNKDTFSGGIKWVDNNGKLSYELNVLVNEGKNKSTNEAAAFADAPGEDAFFSSDAGQSLINGAINFNESPGGVDKLPAKTNLTFNLGLQKITAQQALAFWKLLMLIPNQMYGE